MKGHITATYVDGTKHKVPLQVVFDDLVRDEMHDNQVDFEIAKENVLGMLRSGEKSLVRHSSNMDFDDLRPHIELIGDMPSRLKQKFAWKNAYKEVRHEE